MELLSVAVCLFDDVTALDYQGPVELFGFLTPSNIEHLSIRSGRSFKLTFLSHTLNPVKPGSGPSVLPDDTFDNVLASKTQFDILLVPGGSNARPEAVPVELMNFLKRQIPGALYVLSVCTGSWILAGTGVLDGKRATTNKFAFNSVKEATSNKIDWVAKARWVVDGNVWTSSGVTAGADMANAFLVHLFGEDVAKVVRGIVELSARGEDEDEFAAIHGLLD